MKVISREEASKADTAYKEIMDAESHHNHKIVEVNGVWRWKQDDFVCDLKNKIGLNDIVDLFICLGIDKNNEAYRKLYRDIGYSLSGYWEVFYWDINNEDTDGYRKNKKIEV